MGHQREREREDERSVDACLVEKLKLAQQQGRLKLFVALVDGLDPRPDPAAGDGGSDEPTVRPGTMPRMSRVSSVPTLNTTRPGHWRLTRFAATAAASTYAAVWAADLLHSSGQSHASSPSSAAALPACNTRPMSRPADLHGGAVQVAGDDFQLPAHDAGAVVRAPVPDPPAADVVHHAAAFHRRGASWPTAIIFWIA